MYKRQTYYTSGARSFYTKDKAIRTPADLKGLKIRVQDMKSQTDMMSYLGGIPVAMSYGDVYTSLQTGIIDGTENNETALTTGKHGEVCNWLLGHAGHIIVEDNSYKAFQRGRFGKTIGRHAPAALYAQLTNKAESAGLLVEVVSPKKLKPSQHNLLTDTFVKHELWERRVRLGNDDDDRWIDRDAAACLNLLYADL